MKTISALILGAAVLAAPAYSANQTIISAGYSIDQDSDSEGDVTLEGTTLKVEWKVNPNFNAGVLYKATSGSEVILGTDVDLDINQIGVFGKAFFSEGGFRPYLSAGLSQHSAEVSAKVYGYRN